MEPRGRRVQLHTRQPNATQQEIAMNTFITLASTLVLGLVFNAAHAEKAPKSLTVQFADLDLRADAGAATLFNRIRGAALKVCSTYSSGTTVRDKQRHAACVDFALSNAVARVDRPELTEYVTSRYPIEKKEPARVTSAR
jgi:UrcA family protein